MGQSSSRQSSIAAVKQTFGMSWQWQKKSISTLSRHTCDEGTTMRCGEQQAWTGNLGERRTQARISGDFGASAVSEETVTALQGICLLRLTT